MTKTGRTIYDERLGSPQNESGENPLPYGTHIYSGVHINVPVIIVTLPHNILIIGFMKNFNFYMGSEYVYA